MASTRHPRAILQHMYAIICGWWDMGNDWDVEGGTVVQNGGKNGRNAIDGYNVPGAKEKAATRDL